MAKRFGTNQRSQSYSISAAETIASSKMANQDTIGRPMTDTQDRLTATARAKTHAIKKRHYGIKKRSLFKGWRLFDGTAVWK